MEQFPAQAMRRFSGALVRQHGRDEYIPELTAWQGALVLGSQEKKDQRPHCHAYTVLVFKKKFVIASNTWGEDLRKLDPCDSRWLRDNSVVLYVEEPMLQQEEPPSSSPELTNPWDNLPLPCTSY